MPASYPTTARALNPQNTANDGEVWPNPNLAQAKDYNVLDEELKAVADDLRAASAAESEANITAAIVKLRAAIDAVLSGTDVIVTSGSGSPEGTVEGTKPMLYIDTATGNFYSFKGVDTETTGWSQFESGTPDFSWTTTVPAILVSNTGYFADTVAGAVAVELPAGVVGSTIEIVDAGNNASVNNIVVTPNTTENISGANTPLTLSTDGQAVKLIYTGSVLGWKVYLT